MKPGGLTLSQIVMGVVGVLLLAFLYGQSMIGTSATHERVLYNIRELENMDLQLDEQVIKLRSRLQNNYDPLVTASREIRLRLDELKSGEYAIFLHSDERIDGLMRKLEQAIEHKETLLEEFKSHNAVLKNSLYYLPRTVEHTIRLAPDDQVLKASLHDLLRNVLMAHMGESALDINTQIRDIEARPAPSYLMDSLARTIKHADYVVAYGREVDSLAIKITGQDIHRLVGELASAYEQSFEHALKRANVYRFFLFLVALWLLAYATYSFLKLRETAGKLSEAYLKRSQTDERERTRNQVLELLAKNYSLPEILDPIVRGVETENPAMTCSIMLLEEEGKNLQVSAGTKLPAAYGGAMNGIPVTDKSCLCSVAVVRGERVWAEDFRLQCNAANCPLALKAGLVACWAEPIKSASGTVLGVFMVYWRTARCPDASDIQLIGNATNLASIAIERKQLDESLQLASQVYQNSAEGMVISDSKNRIVAINAAYTQITGYTLEDVLGKEPEIFYAAHHEPAFFEEMWRTLQVTGHWQGEVWDKRKNGEEYAKWMSINSIRNKNGSAHRYLALFSDITEKKKSEELIWRQANYDVLTGLPNRHMFQDRLQQEIKRSSRAESQLALLLIDLDQFKEVNDTLGHASGDTLLQEAARRISTCVRETDTVARLGGDEFTVILSQLTDASHVELISKNIIEQLAAPFAINGETVYVSASMGITFYPQDAVEMESLVKNADQAMYVAKSQGRNCFRYFTSLLQEAAQNRLRLISDLRSALDGQQFLLYYQPIVNLVTGKITKAEALIRWQQPTRGLVSPVEFIPLAEETGLIIEIGNWVFREAARQVKQLRASYDADFQISINKSPVQFRDANSQSDHAWLAYLQELGLPGQSIAIEVTEGLLLHAESNIIDKLLRFRDAGIQVAIDDFGTGYSSLAYLKKFDIDYLKIDRAFVHNLENDSDNMALCEAIIMMAHKLGLMVIAEGVETVAQRDLLAAAGCDYAQGYYFSRPVPAEEFEKLLRSL